MALAVGSVTMFVASCISSIDWQQLSRVSDLSFFHPYLEMMGVEPGTFCMKSMCPTFESALPAATRIWAAKQIRLPQVGRFMCELNKSRSNCLPHPVGWGNLVFSHCMYQTRDGCGY